MAGESNDPYVKAGREITSGKAPAAPAASDDPYVTIGRSITSPAALAADVPTSPPEAPSWTWGGMARQAAAVPLRVAGTVGNVLSNPSANLVGLPAITAWQTAHDFAAPFLGYDRYTPEQRNQLYADFADQPGTRAIQSVGQAVNALPLPSVAGVAPHPAIDPYNIPNATPLETRLGNIGEGALTAGVMGPGGVAAPIMGASGALGGDIAAGIYDNPEDAWKKPFAGMLGTFLGTKAGQAAATLGTKTVNAIRGQTTPVAQAYDLLGIDKHLLGDISEDPTLRLTQAYASRAPFASSRVHPVEQRVVGQFNQALEDTAKRLGTSTTAQTAGETLQNEARNWRDTVFPQRQAAAWAPVDQMLGGETVVPGNYRASLSAITGKLAALPDTAKALVPQRAWDLLAAINKDAPPGQAIPWQDAQNLRTALGQVMGVPEIVQSVGKDQLKRAYGGISQDMRDTAASVDTRNTAAAHASGTAVPPSALDAFTNANKVSTEGHAFLEGPLSRIIRASNPDQEKITGETAAKSVLGSGDTTLEAIRREMPAAADNLAGYKLRDMALATPGAAGATGGETSVGSFLTDLNRFRQQAPAGFQALFSDPAVAARVQALATVADTMKETARRANTSGTGPYEAVGHLSAGVGGTFMATGSPLAALAAPVGQYAVNRLMAGAVTNPILGHIAAGAGPRVLPHPLLTSALVNMRQPTPPNPLRP